MKFANALFVHELLDAAHTELLLTGKVDVGLNVRYAYGFEDTLKDGVRAVGHSGGAPGMSGDLRIYPGSGYVVAALSNGIGAANHGVHRRAAAAVSRQDPRSDTR